jgi:hypothetical protein
VVEQSQDVGMLEPAQYLDLPTESLLPNHRCDFGTQNLYRNGRVELLVVGENDVRGAAFADQRPENVPLRQGCDETLNAAERFLQEISAPLGFNQLSAMSRAGFRLPVTQPVREAHAN